MPTSQSTRVIPTTLLAHDVTHTSHMHTTLDTVGHTHTHRGHDCRLVSRVPSQRVV